MTGHKTEEKKKSVAEVFQYLMLGSAPRFMKISSDTKLTVLILLWVFDKAIMALLFWAIK